MRGIAQPWRRALRDVDRTADAVVFPAQTVAGYGHIEGLAQAGITTHALSSHHSAIFRSRHVRTGKTVPDPGQDPSAFVDALIDFAEKSGKRHVLFMAEDYFAYIASSYKDRLEAWYDYPYIPAIQRPVFFDKRFMHDAAHKAGLSLPRTWYDVEQALADGITFPAIIKPRVSRFIEDTRGLRGVGRFPDLFGGKALWAESPQSLVEKVAAVEGAGFPCCIQEYVPGPNSTIYNVKMVVDSEEGIAASFCSKKERQHPADFGTCTVAFSRLQPSLVEGAMRFCRAVGYSGPACFEFKMDPKDGQWKFIEVNPRLDYWVGMAAKHGVNLPLAQYCLATGQRIVLGEQREGGPAWVDIPNDLRGLRLRRSTPWRVSRWHAIRPYLRFQEAEFNLKDPYPGLRRLVSNLRRKPT